jgi:methyltransferase family protein
MANDVEARGSGRVFDEIVEEYDRHRPAYPDAVDSQPARGLRVVAVEPGERLVARARDRLAGAGEVQFVNARFEEAPVPRAHHRAVFSASAIHWVDPDVSWRKIADTLIDGGTVALLSYFGLDEPGSHEDQQALRAGLARMHPSSPSNGPLTVISTGWLRGRRSGTRTCQRPGHGSGATTYRAGMYATCSAMLSSPRHRSASNTQPMRSTPCWGRCRSGRVYRFGSAKLSAPSTMSSTSCWGGRFARAPSRVW